MTRDWRRLALSLAAVGAPAGCSGDGRPLPQPVEGRVLVDGEPASGVKVCFFSDDPWNEPWKVAPFGVSGDGGRYELQTYKPGDGAPAGNYRVSAVWMTPRRGGRSDEEMTASIDRLGGASADPRTSGLSIEVPPGGGALPPLEIRARVSNKRSAGP